MLSSKTKRNSVSKKKGDATKVATSSHQSTSSTFETITIPDDSASAITPPATTDIETYYRQQGISYAQVRRMNRHYVNYDGPTGEASRGIVFWDTFSPPPGFTVDDLPNSESMILSQPKEETVSPAILAAARYKMKKPRPILGNGTKEDINQLMNRLTKAKRKATSDKENTFEQSAKKSGSPATVVSSALQAVAVSVLESPLIISGGGGGEMEVSSNNSFDSSAEEFPEFDDEDLNDSALMRCTEAAEKEFEQQKNKERDNNNRSPIRVLDLVDPLSAKKFEIKQKTTRLVIGQGRPILSSTPLIDDGGDDNAAVDETPKSVVIPRRSTRNSWSKYRGGVVNSTTSVSSSSSSSILKSESTAKSVSSPSLRRSHRTTLPRMLFPGRSNQNNNNNMEASPLKNKVGDFESDDDDELFSQIEIPNDITKYK